jgi:hypothetical protein
MPFLDYIVQIEARGATRPSTPARSVWGNHNIRRKVGKKETKSNQMLIEEMREAWRWEKGTSSWSKQRIQS